MEMGQHIGVLPLALTPASLGLGQDDTGLECWWVTHKFLTPHDCTNSLRRASPPLPPLQYPHGPTHHCGTAVSFTADRWHGQVQIRTGDSPRDCGQRSGDG